MSLLDHQIAGSLISFPVVTEYFESGARIFLAYYHLHLDDHDYARA